MAFRAGYLLFFILGLAAMSGLLLLELALCYIPSALAIDVFRLRGAVREIRGFGRRQTRRVVFHWLLITTTVVAMGAVMYFLFRTAFYLRLVG